MIDQGAIHEAAFSLAAQVTGDRRHFHRYPELGFQEFETAAYVAERLRHLGIETRTGIAETGVVGIIHGAQPGPTVLLRADMDALPVTEETGAEYASTRAGIMHACGHDGHTAIMLGVAEVLARFRDRLAGTVKLVFQPAEEGPGGAKPMIEAGVMESPHVDACFGLHISTSHPIGTMVVQGGPLQASVDNFAITVEGVGGHGAAPHETVDAIVVGATIVNDLQRIVSRELNPQESAVVTVGTFHAGTRNNIIAPRAELKGTIRTLDPEVQQLVHRRIYEITTGVASAMRARARVDITPLYPATINDHEMAAFARDVAERIVAPYQVVSARPIMGSEDMSHFLNAAPGCYIFLGGANMERGLHHPHHGPLFDFDEACLPIGVELLSSLSVAYLARSLDRNA